MGQIVHSLTSEEIKIMVSVVVLILHFVFVRFRVYEKVLFFLAGYSNVVNAFLQFLISVLAEMKHEEVKKILREIGLQIYILVEQWARKTDAKGEQKFEKFLEIMKGMGVDVDRNKNEITKFVEIVNFVQNNTNDNFFEKAKEVVNDVFASKITTNILGKFVKIMLGIFGILKVRGMMVK
jgi:hypothetical protein